MELLSSGNFLSITINRDVKFFLAEASGHLALAFSTLTLTESMKLSLWRPYLAQFVSLYNKIFHKN